MRLEMGQPQVMNDQNKVFELIFYKGNTFSNYKEACHALSCNNCVLMDDLFEHCLRKGNLTQQWPTNSTKKLESQILTINHMKKLYLAICRSTVF